MADGGEGGKEREKRRERVTERKDDKGQRKRDEWAKGMLGREKGGERRLCSLDDPERTIYQSVLSIIRVYSCRPRINPAPPSLPPLLFASVKFSRSPAVVLN